MPVDLTAPGAVEAALFSPYEEATRADPWPLCHKLREEAPVFETTMGTLVLTRYADCAAVLRDPRFSVDPRKSKGSDGVGELSFSQRGFDNVMLFEDPPDHTRLRGLVSKAFTPRAIAALKARIEELVDEFIDDIVDAGETDLISALAYPLTVTVIAEMLGIPGADRDSFRSWSTAIAPILDPFIPPEQLPAMSEAAMHLVGYVHELVMERRKNPGSDLVSALIHAEEEGDKLTTEEVHATVLLLLIAGHETTMNAIGNGMLALFHAPDQLERLRNDPGLVRTATEEILRHDGSIMQTARNALEPLEVAGKSIDQGTLVVTVIGAANRDPAQFEDPDRLDIGRDPNRHLAFSAGPHFCLGAQLARLEIQIALRGLVTRLPTLRLVEEPKWRPTVTFRGLQELRVAV